MFSCEYRETFKNSFFFIEHLRWLILKGNKEQFIQDYFLKNGLLSKSCTGIQAILIAWKVSKYGVFLVRIFPHSDWKDSGPEKTPYLTLFTQCQLEVNLVQEQSFADALQMLQDLTPTKVFSYDIC